jgi:hypothetical protein
VSKINIAELRIGQEVHYQPEHYGDDRWENGLIKEIREGKTDGVWVVYNCNGEWHRYQDYTGCLTNLTDLKLGWRHE